MPLSETSSELEVERIVLGTAFQDDLWVQQLAQDCLNPPFECSAPAHAAIVTVLQQVCQRDPVLRQGNTLDGVIAELERRGELATVGGHEYLHDLQQCARDEQKSRKAIKEFMDCAARRQLATVAAALRAVANDRSSEPLKSIVETRQQLADIAARLKPAATDTAHAVVDAVSFLQTLLSASDGSLVKTGYRDLDGLLVGLRPGDLCVFAALPQVDLNAFLAGIILRTVLAPEGGVQAGLLTRQSSPMDLLVRLIQCSTPIELERITACEATKREWYELAGAADKLLRVARAGRLTVCRTVSQSVDEVRILTGMMVQDSKIKLLIVDGTEVLGPDNGPGGARTSARIVSGLKEMAHDYNIPVLLLAGLHQQPVDMQTAPTLASLYELGPLAADADLVALLWHAVHGISQAEIGNTDVLNIFIARHWYRPGRTSQLRYRREWRSYEDMPYPTGGPDILELSN